MAPLQNELYDIRTLPSKGRALVAVRSVDAGALLVSERPFALVPSASLDAASARTAFLKLPAELQDSLLAFHNARDELGPILGRFRTNAIPALTEDGQDARAFFETVLLVNHSCRPNAKFSWDQEASVERLHALRKIDPEEEITVSYGSEALLPWEARQAHLQASFGFRCDCEACSLPSHALSDDRRTRYLALCSSYQGLIASDPRLALDQLNEALSLAEDEDLVGELGSKLWEGFQICAFYGSAEHAKAWIEAALDRAEMERGSGSPEATRMRALVDGVEQFEHWAEVELPTGMELVGPSVKAGMASGGGGKLSKGQKKSARAKAKKLSGLDPIV